MRAESFFLPASDGERYCIHYPPQGNLRGTLLYLHPFAEEMNKSRRMAAAAARAFSAQGWAVLQIDLHGCGDSSGDFGDATWQAWLDDAQRGAQWLVDRYDRIDALWGLRLGALLACAIAPLIEPVDLLLWQPVLSGSQHMTQFLRLRAAAEMLDATDTADTRGGTKALRENLQRGESVEVAGYDLAPALVLPLDALRLQLPPNYAGAVYWFEIGSAMNPTLSPASTQFIDICKQRNIAVEVRCVQGLPFWQGTEIAEVPELIAASVAILDVGQIHAKL